MFRDEGLDQLLCVLGQIPQLGCVIVPNLMLQVLLIHLLGTAQLSAIAARGTEAHAIRIRQNSVEASFS